MWQTRLGQYVSFGPAEAREGVLAVAGERGAVYTLNAASGEVLWEVDVGRRPAQAPVLDGEGRLLMATEQEVVALGREGEVLWELAAGPNPRVLADPAGPTHLLSGAESRVLGPFSNGLYRVQPALFPS